MSEEPTELSVTEVRENNGMIEVDCWHHGYDEQLILKFPYCQLPKPDAPFAVSHGSATDSKALQSALYVEGLLGNLMNGDKSAIKTMNAEALVILIQFARDKANKPIVPPETLQRLIDFAHAAMSKRSDVEDDFVVTRSRKHTGGHADLNAKDLRSIQAIGKPSWGDTGSTK